MDKSKIWSDFGAPPQLNVQAGGWGAAPPFATFVGFLILMRFIDPRIFYFNEIHGPNPGPEENMQIGGLRGAISQIWPKFREMLGKKSS